MQLKISCYNCDCDRSTGVCCHNALGLVRRVPRIPRPNGLGIWLPRRTRPRARWQQASPELVLIPWLHYLYYVIRHVPYSDKHCGILASSTGEDIEDNIWYIARWQQASPEPVLIPWLHYLYYVIRHVPYCDKHCGILASSTGEDTEDNIWYG